MSRPPEERWAVRRQRGPLRTPAHKRSRRAPSHAVMGKDDAMDDCLKRLAEAPSIDEVVAH